MSLQTRVSLGSSTAKRTPQAVVRAPSAVPASHLWAPRTTIFAMYGNDKYPDCGPAAVGHMEQVWNVANGKTYAPSLGDVLAIYNGTPNHPDAHGNPGRLNSNVLDYVKNHGLTDGTHKLFWRTWPVEEGHVKEAIYRLGGGYFISYGLPVSAQSQRVWRTVSSNSNVGSWGWHTVCLAGYNATGPIAITWGRLVQMTWSFHARYADGLGAACLGWDWAPGSVTPLGESWAALAKSFGI